MERRRGDHDRPSAAGTGKTRLGIPLEFFLCPPQKGGRGRHVFAPCRRTRTNAPARGAERAHRRGHRAHELIESRTDERREPLSPIGIARDWSDRRDTPLAIAAGGAATADYRP